ncbi:MAG: hypothetical protein ACRDGB_10795, partial [Candidatus Limnocylindria bacterium]
FRLWAREHRTRWSFRLHHPHFEAATESPDLGQALCDLARVCAVMAEPFGVPAGRVSSDVPGVIPGGPRPLPAADDATKAGASEEPPVASPATDGDEPAPAEDQEDEAKPTAVPIGDGEEVIDLSEEEKEAVPTRSDDQA